MNSILPPSVPQVLSSMPETFSPDDELGRGRGDGVSWVATDEMRTLVLAERFPLRSVVETEPAAAP